MAKAGDKPVVLGFLTVRTTTGGGFRGGYLLTSEYGRPIEFHYTAELKVSKRHQILHGAAYEPYVYAEVLAKPMTDQQGTAPRAILVDRPQLLSLRPLIPAAVIYLDGTASEGSSIPRAEVHPAHPQDNAAFGVLQKIVPTNFDWLEPFQRISEALAEIQDPEVLLAA